MTMMTTPQRLVPLVNGAAPAAAGDPTLRLAVTKATVLRHLKMRIEQGMSIRRHRIRYAEDLEEVRQRKAEWVQAYSDLLMQAFQGDAGTAVVDSCNNWMGRVYPEYAEMELFVEQFYEEMDYRVSRLRAVAQQVAGMADIVPPVPRPSPAPAGGAAPAEGGSSGKATLIDAVAKPAPTPPPAAAKGKPAGAVVAASPSAAEVAPAPEAPLSSGLFVVHGGASPAAEPVRRFLRDLGIHLLSLPGTAQANKSLVATLEQGPAASFAVLLLNPEDSAALQAPGACRPAITFQLGYFVGRLGLPRVCVLCEGGSDVFHDEHGILCLPLDPANGWHLQLARHLKRAGIEVDLNKLC
jgi:hypothetical protein